MPVYFQKLWHEGESRAEAGPPLDPQPAWPKPQYRPGWTIAYKTHSMKRHVGKIEYVFREGPGRVDFYRVVRTKNGAREITFDTSIIERIQEEAPNA